MLSVKCVLDLIKISQFVVSSVSPFLRFLCIDAHSQKVVSLNGQRISRSDCACYQLLS
jgi:hypothetical protein